jgi:hypothetical protein
MRKTSQLNGLTNDKVTITTKELQAMLSSGRRTAVNIGTAAEAEVRIGKRLLWNVDKIKKYVNEISR